MKEKLFLIMVLNVDSQPNNNNPSQDMTERGY